METPSGTTCSAKESRQSLSTGPGFNVAVRIVIFN